MKPRVYPAGLWLAILMVALSGCATAARKPAVAILVGIPGLGRPPSPEEMASIRSVLQPEIERRGYMVAKDIYHADYVVSVSNLSDPLGGRLRLEKVPERNIDRDRSGSGDMRSLSQRAGTGMPQEPSRETRE